MSRHTCRRRGSARRAVVRGVTGDLEAEVGLAALYLITQTPR